MATIYLIRHGQASFGAANYDQLSPLGQLQAQRTGQYLARAGVDLDAAYSGDLSRQRETCERVCAELGGGIPHTVDVRFNEIRNDEQVKRLAPVVASKDPAIDALLQRGLSSSKDYQKVIEAVFNHWVSHDCSEYGIQSWEEYSALASDALLEVMRSEGGGKTVGIFTSGGTIATIVAQVLGLNGAQTYRFYEPIFNCSVTQLFYSGTRVSLSYFNDCSFLQMLGQEHGEKLISYR
ncbi:histidine phosphatase family protein [Pseudohalioglobus lutimaris]|uniref:Histidine phosphatase family protein n=1 Tax=Pseudohalioglobus lutimaris TaxID=1737061 RepID=A0A2N5X7K1_9GAMM|nr:histidine phosphatase family protein [Pseudohalioglobus lutimaris]PLW70460.1 histidine phosphatase family protein [Pseudohalioglobus lutimaris]